MGYEVEVCNSYKEGGKGALELANKINKELGINKEYIIKASLGFCNEMKEYNEGGNAPKEEKDYDIKSVLERAKERLGIDVGETTKDGKFSLEATRCIGACGLAPVFTVNEEVYGRLVKEDVDGILEKYGFTK